MASVWLGLVALAIGLLLAGGGGGSSHHVTQTSSTGTSTANPLSTTTVGPQPPAVGIHKIRHIVIIMQENRSFDSYFGPDPGADGIQGLAGDPGTVPCLPDPSTGGCMRPFDDVDDQNLGGPPSFSN